MTESKTRSRTRKFARPADTLADANAAPTTCKPRSSKKSDTSMTAVVAPHAPPEAPEAAAPKSKAELVLGLLRRDTGATLNDLVTATGWLPHTTRAALTGIKRKGHVLSSEKVDGVRTYRVSSAGAPT